MNCNAKIITKKTKSNTDKLQHTV